MKEYAAVLLYITLDWGFRIPVIKLKKGDS